MYLGFDEVMVPEGSNLLLTPNIPHGESYIPVMQRLQVETNSRGGDYGLCFLKFTQKGGLACKENKHNSTLKSSSPIHKTCINPHNNKPPECELHIRMVDIIHAGGSEVGIHVEYGLPSASETRPVSKTGQTDRQTKESRNRTCTIKTEHKELQVVFVSSESTEKSC